MFLEPSTLFALYAVLMLLLGGVLAPWALGHVRGWAGVAKLYRASQPRSGPRFGCRWYRVHGRRLRPTKVAGRFTLDAAHLHVSVHPLSRPGHPPFSVPYQEITVRRDTLEWGFFTVPVVAFSFARAPGADFMTPTDIGEDLVARSEGRLKLRDNAPAGLPTSPQIPEIPSSPA